MPQAALRRLAAGSDVKLNAKKLNAKKLNAKKSNAEINANRCRTGRS